MALFHTRTFRFRLVRKCFQLKVSTSDKTSHSSASRMFVSILNAGNQPKVIRIFAFSIRKCIRMKQFKSIPKFSKISGLLGQSLSKLLKRMQTLTMKVKFHLVNSARFVTYSMQTFQQKKKGTYLKRFLERKVDQIPAI